MSKFFDDTMEGLLEAVAIDKGKIPVKKVEGLMSPTYRAENIESDLIDQVINLRKQEKVSQADLALLTGDKQQNISRFEKKAHTPSLTLFVKIIDALGYEMKIVKK